VELLEINWWGGKNGDEGLGASPPKLRQLASIGMVSLIFQLYVYILGSMKNGNIRLFSPIL
jgi:hypothetical protein